MGSRAWAGIKMLSVFLMVAGTLPSAWTISTTSTNPVPILRYIDTQNTDGSYTFGFEGADGTYKLETRFVDGRVKGKYGYFDPEGVFREASYGAEAGRGFEPEIAGVNLPPPTIVQEIQNEIPQGDTIVPQKFENFKPKSAGKEKLPTSLPERSQVADTNRVKIVNGRRAVLKKRLRAKATPAPAEFIEPAVQREHNLQAREEQLKSLRQHRQQLLQLQRSKARQGLVRADTGHRQLQAGRALAPPVGVRDPYVKGLDINSGSYSYSYKK